MMSAIGSVTALLWVVRQSAWRNVTRQFSVDSIRRPVVEQHSDIPVRGRERQRDDGSSGMRVGRGVQSQWCPIAAGGGDQRPAKKLTRRRWARAQRSGSPAAAHPAAASATPITMRVRTQLPAILSPSPPGEPAVSPHRAVHGSTVRLAQGARTSCESTTEARRRLSTFRPAASKRRSSASTPFVCANSRSIS